MPLANLVLLLVCWGIVRGCFDVPSLIGTWRMKIPDKKMAEKGDMTVTFSEPDKFRWIMIVHTDGEGKIGSRTEVAGTWKLDGDQLLLTSSSKDFKVTFLGTGGVFDDLNESSKKDVHTREVVNSGAARIKWEGKDRFVMTGSDGKVSIFERLKS